MSCLSRHLHTSSTPEQVETKNLRFIKLFKRMIDQFDRLRRRNAFLEQYKKEKMFENGLEEFDDAR